MGEAERLEDHARDIQNNVLEIMEILQRNIELSERVQELEEHNLKYFDLYGKLKKENKRLREALEDIAEGVGPPESIAKYALEGED